jgi:hypothetical protein
VYDQRYDSSRYILRYLQVAVGVADTGRALTLWSQCATAGNSGGPNDDTIPTLHWSDSLEQGTWKPPIRFETTAPIKSAIGVAFGPQDVELSLWTDNSNTLYSTFSNDHWAVPRPLDLLDNPNQVVHHNGVGAIVAMAGNPYGGGEIQAAAFSPHGGWSSPATLVAPNQQGEPVFGLDEAGAARALWTVPRVACNTCDSCDCFNQGVWSASFTPTDGWGRPTKVQDATDQQGATGKAYDVSVTSGGTTVAAWASSNGDIWLARYTRSAGWQTPVRIGNAPLPTEIKVAADPAGDALVLVVGYDLWAGRVRSDDTIEPLQRLSNLTWPNHLASDTAGNGVAVWYSANHIQSARYTLGSGWGPVTTLAGGAAELAAFDFAFDPHGGAFVIWSQHVGETSEVWVKHLGKP